MNTSEQELRIQLAACYRIFDYLGWSELIYNHITVKIPGSENHFLINPYGLGIIGVRVEWHLLKFLRMAILANFLPCDLSPFHQ